jgi:hypothetical protein
VGCEYTGRVQLPWMAGVPVEAAGVLA